MFKTLLKSRLDAFLASFSGAGNANKKSRSRTATVLLIILFAFLACYLIGAFALMSFGMDTVSLETKDFWLSPTIASLLSVSLCIIGSVFTAKTQIFESKDNELLLSMPIEPKYIFLSRITMLLIVNYALESLVMLPSIAVHSIVVGYSFIEAVFTFLVFMMIPFLSLTVSTLLAWVISVISSKVRNKTLVSVVFTFLFMAVYLIACGAIGGFAGSEEGVNIDFSGLKNTYIFYWMGSAMGEGNALNFLYFALCAIIPAIITFILLDRSFIKIITTVRGVKKIAYKAKSERTNRPTVALYKKELRRFFTSSAYILNAGMGNIMTVIVAVMMSVLSSDMLATLEQEPMLKNMIPTMFSMLIVFLASMNLVSAPSISLEDKNLWILQSSPIHPKSILMAKLLTHITICTPLTVISAIVVGIAYKFTIPNLIMLIAASISTILFTGYFGLFLGLKFPKFDWQNETVAVKQGFAVFGTMFGSMIWAMIFFVLGMALAVFAIPFWIPGLIFTIANLLVCLPIHLYFSRGGAARFASLKH